MVSLSGRTSSICIMAKLMANEGFLDFNIVEVAKVTALLLRLHTTKRKVIQEKISEERRREAADAYWSCGEAHESSKHIECMSCEHDRYWKAQEFRVVGLLALKTTDRKYYWSVLKTTNETARCSCSYVKKSFHGTQFKHTQSQRNKKVQSIELIDIPSSYIVTVTRWIYQRQDGTRERLIRGGPSKNRPRTSANDGQITETKFGTRRSRYQQCSPGDARIGRSRFIATARLLARVPRTIRTFD
jgi:hypothetical protein